MSAPTPPEHQQRAQELCEGLLRDVRTSCRRGAAAIERRSEPELESHRREAIEALVQIDADVSAAIKAHAETGIDLPALAVLAKPYSVFRRTRLPFFSHYGAGERYLTRLAALLCDQAGFIRTPLIGTFSSTGFWTDAKLKTICVPAGEYGGLLGVPDLVHELAHILLYESGGELSAPFLREVVVPYTQTFTHTEFGLRLFSQYHEWQIEFMADVIASHVCGPCYGWQHIRLNAQRGAIAQPWLPDTPSSDPNRQRHPADGARTHVIAAALDARARGSGAALKTRWDTLTSAAGAPSDDYTSAYPEKLLDELVKRTLAWCELTGVVAFAQAPQGGVIRRVDQAWGEQLSDPAGFEKRESEHVRALVEMLDQAPA
jgi:hypothetical protein